MKKTWLGKAAICRAVAGMSLVAILILSSPRWGRAQTASFRWHEDADFFYVESNGMAAHRMLAGITQWQQQVAIPQDYTGDNAWRIPKKPVWSDKPVNVRNALFSGAIAVALNGIPIFNPIKVDGKTDTYAAGELDDYGGHCGRADDYHYHIVPPFMVEMAGKGNPVAYALDGYKIYGPTEADDSKPQGLDEFNGHKDANGVYHYHMTRVFPYLNGGEHGAVKVQKDAIVPQPWTAGVRKWTPMLPGSTIINFTIPQPNNYSLEYTIAKNHYFINYAMNDNGSYTFNFVAPDGSKKTETYPPGKIRLSAYLNANNSGNAVVKPGQDVLYAWGSTSATGGSATVQVFKSTDNEKPTNPVASDGCGTNSGPFSAVNSKFGAAHIAAKACQSGYTYKYTFTAVNGDQKVSDDAIVTVN
jgi:YHYH protein